MYSLHAVGKWSEVSPEQLRWLSWGHMKRKNIKWLHTVCSEWYSVSLREPHCFGKTLFKAEIFLTLAAELKWLVHTSLNWVPKLNQFFGLLEAWIAPDKLYVVITFKKKKSFVFTTSSHLPQLLRRLYFCCEVPEMFCGLQNFTSECSAEPWSFETRLHLLYFVTNFCLL